MTFHRASTYNRIVSDQGASPQSPAQGVDYLPLKESVSRREVNDYRNWARANDQDLPNPLMWASSIVILVVMAMVWFIFLFIGVLVFGIIYSSAQLAEAGSNRAIPIGTQIIFALVTGLVIFWAVRLTVDIARRDVRFRVNWKRSLQLNNFARVNGLSYKIQTPNPRSPAAIFSEGSHRRSYDIVGNRSLEIGNYQYGGTWYREPALRRFGYVRIQLPRVMPNMVLEARANRRLFGRSNLPWTYKGRQMLSLEGDFDRYFTLYAPREYERDALYLFTPDLMVLFIDFAAPLDVEIINDGLFMYSPRPFAMTNRATYEMILAVLHTVGLRTAKRSARYTDDRVKSRSVVALKGQRLLVRLPVGAFVVALVYVALVLRYILFH